MYKKAGNVYQKTPFHRGPDKFCEYLQKNSKTFVALINSSDLPNVDVCPWPAKTYTVIDYNIPIESIPEYFEGDYMFEVSILLNDEVVNGFQTYLTIISV